MKNNFLLLTIAVLLLVFACQQKKEQNQTEKLFTQDSISFSLIWEVLADEYGVLNERVEKPNSVEKAEFSPDESKIITVAKGDNSIRLFDAASREEIWKIYADEETDAATFTRNGKRLNH